MIDRNLRVLLTVVVLAGWVQAQAVTIADELVAGPTFTFRDTRTLTQTGFFIGDRIAIAVLDVTPSPDSGIGGDQTVVTARQAGVSTELVFFSGGALSSQYVNSVPFDPALTGSWDIEISNAGSPVSPLVVTTQPLGPTSLVPFVTDGRMTPHGITPRIGWDQPPGFAPDVQRLFVFDLDRQALDGSALVIHTEDLPGAATFFDIPATMDLGDSLAFGGHYEIAVMMQKLRPDGSVLSRSRTFYAFSPIASGPTVELPTVGPDGIFHFDIGIDSGEAVILDPRVATGYQYRIGEDDPLFSSVSVLTDLGIGAYELLFESGGTLFSELILPSTRYDFPLEGVEAFSITGIDPMVGLDPRLTTAFLTEVSFTAAGRFTGIMMPLVETGTPVTAWLLSPLLLALWPALGARRDG